CRNSRPTTVAVQRRDLAVDELPVDLACELHQLVPHVDDLVQPRADNGGDESLNKLGDRVRPESANFTGLSRTSTSPGNARGNRTWHLGEAPGKNPPRER